MSLTVEQHKIVCVKRISFGGSYQEFLKKIVPLKELCGNKFPRTF